MTDLSERQLRAGVFKFATVLIAAVALVALGITWLAGAGQSIAINFLLISMALMFLANGVLAVLGVVDWFESRKRRNG